MGAEAVTRRVERLAASQHGNVGYAQLIAVGLSRAQVEHRLARGWLIARHRGVYAVGHVPGGRRSRWSAATLALGPGAALSHRSAAASLGILKGAVATEVTVSPATGRAARDGIVVHRAVLAAHEVVMHEGIVTTTPLRTVLDLATVLTPWALGRAVEEAQLTCRLSVAELAAEVAGRRGRRGSARLRALLVGAVDADELRSVLELRFRRLCAASAIPEPVANRQIGRWRPDFAWHAARLIVETDGAAFHRSAAKQHRDAEKDAALIALGWRVLRLTWADVTQEPGRTARRVRDALATRPE